MCSRIKVLTNTLVGKQESCTDNWLAAQPTNQLNFQETILIGFTRGTLNHIPVHTKRQDENTVKKYTQLTRGCRRAAPSEEVWSGVDWGNDSLVIWYSIKQLGLFLSCGSEAKNGGHIASPVAVVRGRPYCHQFAVEHVLDACKGARLL